MIGRAAAFALATLSACRFDPAGLPGGGGDDAATPDAGAPKPDAPVPTADASPCPEDFVVQLRVDGQEAPGVPGEPIVNVLLGDRVRLSAAGSCVAHGPISFAWEISPDDGTADSAAPGLDAEELDVFSLVPGGLYTVRLEVTDAVGNTEAREVLAFAAFGWATFGPAPGDGNINDVHFGGTDVWIAAHDGAFRYGIDDRAGGFHDLETELEGDDPGNDMQTAWYDEAAALAWFGHKDARTGVWRVSRTPGRIDLIRIDGGTALGAAAIVHDIGGAGPGVAVASNLGVTTAPDNLTFSTRFTPLNNPAVFALGRGGAAAWAGGARLYDLADEGAVIDPFGGAVGPDDKIRAIAVDDARGDTWIATQGNGVVRLRTATGETIGVYGEDDGLADDDVRDLVIEQSGDFAGDVWAATKTGVSRWLRERDEWVAMGNAQGLVADDIRAVTIDSERWIYGGTDRGVVYIRLP